MQLFDYLADIISLKQNKPSSNLEDYEDFVPFMMQRWLSFYSKDYTKILNCTSNRMWRAIDSKEMWYKLLMSVLPRERFSRIAYIKKNKEKLSNNIDKVIIEKIAERMELSEREVMEYIQINKTDIKQLKKLYGDEKGERNVKR